MYKFFLQKYFTYIYRIFITNKFYIMFELFYFAYLFLIALFLISAGTLVYVLVKEHLKK